MILDIRMYNEFNLNQTSSRGIVVDQTHECYDLQDNQD